MTEPERPLPNGLAALWRGILDRHGFGAALLVLFLATVLGWIPSAPVRAFFQHVERDRYRDYVLWQLCERMPVQATTDAAAKNCLKPWRED